MSAYVHVEAVDSGFNGPKTFSYWVFLSILSDGGRSKNHQRPLAAIDLCVPVSDKWTRTRPKKTTRHDLIKHQVQQRADCEWTTDGSFLLRQ